MSKLSIDKLLQATSFVSARTRSSLSDQRHQKVCANHEPSAERKNSPHIPDIYNSHTKHLEHFTRTDWLDLGEGEDGIIWERDPVRHRQVRKSLSPAFSVKSLQAKEPTLHKHINYFLERMKELGDQENGVDLREV